MTASPFPERARVDAWDKVTGTTLYAADLPFRGMLYAMTVPAGIAKGRVAAVPKDVAMRVPGVVRVLTQEDFPAPPPPPAEGEEGPPPPPPTLESGIAYRGQPVALVIAETLEAAIEGAEVVRPRYLPAEFASVLDSVGGQRRPAKPVTFGSAGPAMATAAATVDTIYESPTQHHNPIELISTIGVFSGGRLTIHESTQDTPGVRNAVSGALGIARTIGDGRRQRGGRERRLPCDWRAGAQAVHPRRGPAVNRLRGSCDAPTVDDGWLVTAPRKH